MFLFTLENYIRSRRQKFKKKAENFFSEIFFFYDNYNWYENASLVIYDRVLGKTQILKRLFYRNIYVYAH